MIILQFYWSSPPHLSRLTLSLFLFYVVNRHRHRCHFRQWRDPLSARPSKRNEVFLCLCVRVRDCSNCHFICSTALSSILMPKSFVVRLQWHKMILCVLCVCVCARVERKRASKIIETIDIDNFATHKSFSFWVLRQRQRLDVACGLCLPNCFWLVAMGKYRSTSTHTQPPENWMQCKRNYSMYSV